MDEAHLYSTTSNNVSKFEIELRINNQLYQLWSSTTKIWNFGISVYESGSTNEGIFDDDSKRHGYGVFKWTSGNVNKGK